MFAEGVSEVDWRTPRRPCPWAATPRMRCGVCSRAHRAERAVRAHAKEHPARLQGALGLLDFD
eukprot:5384515-Pyramimonas_sp.AAC.1